MAETARASRSWWDRLDTVAVVRGASAGFSVLVIGGLAQPLALRFVPVAGQFELTIAAVLAFAVAGWRTGHSAVPVVQGLITAVSAYCLVLPLVFMLTGVHPVQVVSTLALAAGTGAAAGFLRGRFGPRFS